MDPKSAFAIKLLEKIGAPLIKAVEKPAGQSEENAEVIARLLGQAVKMSIALNGTLGVEENEAQADSTRMALAAIVSPLLAAHYEEHKKEPAEQDIQRMIKSLEVVMSFADKFKPAEEGQSRLSTIDHTTPFFDETQGVLNTMLAMTPVIPAIYEFSFGRPENKLMQDIAAKLEGKAQQLAGDNKIGQILVLQALATVYADCHRAATAAIAQSDGDARQSPTMDPIWEDFERRTLMLAALTGQEGNEAVGAPVSVAPTQEVQPVQGPATVEQEQPVATSAPLQSAPAASGNPMSFFGSKDSNAPAEVPTSAPPTSPPAAETPVTAAQSAQDETANDFAESGKPDESGNPMSFFGKKKEDE